MGAAGKGSVMPFDGTGYDVPRRGSGGGSPAPRSARAEALSWVISFAAVWLPFLAAVLWVEFR